MLEAIISAGTEAILGYLLDNSSLADRGKEFLGVPDTYQSALKVALARAYEQFLAGPHAWAASSLFDQHFLTSHAAPLLARCLKKDGCPQPSELAEVWAAQFAMLGQTKSEMVVRVEPVARHFLELLTHEIRKSEVLRPLIDSQDLSKLVNLVTSIAQNQSQTEALADQHWQELSQSLQNAQSRYYDVYIKKGSGAAIGENATVYNVTFNGPILFDVLRHAPPTVKTYIRNFETYRAERAVDFIGRSFLFDEIDGWLNTGDISSGYLVISGQPGIGKTALCAEIINRIGCVHHFNIRRQGISLPSQFLESVCAQIIVRYGLHEYSNWIPARADSDFLTNLLSKAATQSNGSPVLIVVDALDEAELSPDDYGRNPLDLPMELPMGVFVLLTRRPVDRKNDPLRVANLKELEIRHDDPRNVQDVYAYVYHFLEANEAVMAPRIAEWGTTKATFSDILSRYSDGNFMYARSVLWDIRSGVLSYADIGAIEHLPVGLEAYYREHRRFMQVRDPLYDDIICVLSTFETPFSVTELAAMTGHESRKIRNTLENWRSLLTVRVDANGHSRFGLYHQSFKEYLEQAEECGDRWRSKMISDLEGLLGSVSDRFDVTDL
mgnify:CR=1 FL=1